MRRGKLLSNCAKNVNTVDVSKPLSTSVNQVQSMQTPHHARLLALWLSLTFAAAFATLWQTANAASPGCCGPITAQGQQLQTFLDQSGVEHLWLPHVHVHWLSGEPDLKRPTKSRRATHCSGYVAAMSVRLNVPLLRPPQHRAGMLATPQAHWLSGVGKTQGWRAVSMQQAQTLANAGEFVLAVWANPNPRHSGHIAIVRPSEQGAAHLAQYGPELTMAGHINALRISTARGFEDHKGAWVAGGKGSVRYFTHTVDWAKVTLPQ